MQSPGLKKTILCVNCRSADRNETTSMSACCLTVTPLEGVKSHRGFTLSRDLNSAEGFIRGNAGLQDSSNCFSQFDQLVRFFRECADKNLCIYLQRSIRQKQINVRIQRGWAAFQV